MRVAAAKSGETFWTPSSAVGHGATNRTKSSSPGFVHALPRLSQQPAANGGGLSLASSRGLAGSPAQVWGHEENEAQASLLGSNQRSSRGFASQLQLGPDFNFSNVWAGEDDKLVRTMVVRTTVQL